MAWQALQNAPTDLSGFWSNIAPDMPSSLGSLRSMIFPASQVVLGAQHVLAQAPSCPNAQLSCHNTSVVEDLCCFNAPGGQMLQTQFWDTSPPTGPADAWTVHGLWPDKCDGSYEANCDSTRVYNNVSAILQSFDATELLSNMTTYWKDYQGDDETLWAHEWSKHGTCVSTLSPSCYGDSYTPQQEVLDYFNAAVGLYQTLPTYEWLKEAGIVPSETDTYTSEQIQSVLTEKHGYEVTIGCRGGAFDQVWYHFDVRGSVQTGTFVPTTPDGSKSTCPTTGIKYVPKESFLDPTGTKSTTAPTATATGAPFSGKGYLNVVASGATKGCIISGGTWYASGTCATFRASEADDGFTLTSSKGKCAVADGALSCAAAVTQASTFESDGLNLVYGGNNTFFADGTPSASKQRTVYVEEEGHALGVEIQWQSI